MTISGKSKDESSHQECRPDRRRSFRRSMSMTSVASLKSAFRNISNKALPEITIHKWKGRKEKNWIPEQDEVSIYVDALGDVAKGNTPHESLECPPLYMLLKMCPPLLRAVQAIYSVRWNLTYPLQRRIPLKGAFFRKMGLSVTYGEVLLIMPFIAMFIVGILYAFWNPSVVVSGQIARAPLALALISGTHNSIITMLLGMPFERILFYHKLSGRLAFINGIFHTYVCFAFPTRGTHRNVAVLMDHAIGGLDPNFWEYLWHGSINISGTCILSLVFCSMLTSLPYVRTVMFELFLYLHVVFALSMVVCAFFHSGWLVVMLAGAFYGTDLLIRKVLMAMVLYPRKAFIKLLTPEVVEIAFPKPTTFNYNPGQYVYMAIPELSVFEWHPFSISSSPHQPFVTFHIRIRGNWTKELGKLAKHGCQDGMVDILIEGPYGSVGVDLFSRNHKYKSIMLFSGGIGVTPMQSICHQLMYEHETGLRQKLSKVLFMWTARDPEILDNMDISNHSSRSGRGSVDSGRNEIDMTAEEYLDLELGDSKTHNPALDDALQPKGLDDTSETDQDEFKVVIEDTSVLEDKDFKDFQESTSIQEDQDFKVVQENTMIQEGKQFNMVVEDTKVDKNTQVDKDTQLDKNTQVDKDTKVVDDNHFFKIENIPAISRDRVILEDEFFQRSLDGASVLNDDEFFEAKDHFPDDSLQRMYGTALLVPDHERSPSRYDFSNITKVDEHYEESLGEQLATEQAPPLGLKEEIGDEPEPYSKPPLRTVPSGLARDSPDGNASVASSLSEDDEVLQLELFLTSKKAKRPEAINPYVSSGRPDIKGSFILMKEEAKRRGENCVAVCVCAPETLVNICRDACIQYSDNKLRFDFHSEIFG